MLLLLLGIIQFGTVFRDYIALTDATRVGARQASVARSIQPESDRVPNVIAKVHKAAVNLDKTQMTITVEPIKVDGVTPGWEQSGDVTVRATYPFKINIAGMVLFAGTLKSRTDRARRVASRTAHQDQITLCSGRGAAFANRSTDRGVTSTNGSRPSDEVADDLADGGALQEAVAGEARRVEEARDLGDSPTSALWSGVTS